jgi:hypothetical protein
MTNYFDDYEWKRQETERHHARLLARAAGSITHRPARKAVTWSRTWTVLFLAGVLVMLLGVSWGEVA